MSCARNHLLESYVMGELGPPEAAELTAHLKGCGRCRHEVDWLKTEYGLFRMRAGRDEVASLWAGVAKRSGLVASPRRHRVAMMAMAMAMTVALVLPLGLWAAGDRGMVDPSEVSSSPAEAQSFTTVRAEPAAPECSSMPEGLGFRCGPVAQASFFASR